MRTDWMVLGECVGSDTEIFFGKEHVELAKSICGSCQVAGKCREFATANNERGVWGGVTDDERDKTVASAGMTSHGTELAYHKHIRLGTVPCASCRRAHAQYRWRKRNGVAV